MALAIWNDSYKTGDGTVDSQHQALFAMVNELHDAILAGHGRDRIGSTLVKLGAYVATHFQTEERLMQAQAYPAFLAHKAKHDALGKDAAKVISDYESGRAMLTIALSRFLADWLRHHIDGEDKAMISWMRQRNARA